MNERWTQCMEWVNYYHIESELLSHKRIMWMRDEHNVWSELLSHRVRELCEWEMNTMYGVNYYHI